MKRYILSFAVVAGISGGFTACRKADAIPRKSSSVLSDIYATLEGRGKDRLFEPKYGNDTIYFDIPYYYPVDSDNETDIKKIIVRSTIPTDASMAPTLGGLMDLTNPIGLQVTAGNGSVSKYVLVGKRVADLDLRKASISYVENGATQTIDAIINNTTREAIFYVIPGTNVTNVALTTELNPHSQPSLANGTSINLNQNVAFTVTGVDGSKKAYTLKAVEPVKLTYGVGISRLLWKKNATDITGFTTNDNNRSMAVSGDYIVLALSTTPSTYKVYNRTTGAYVQDMTVPPGSLRSFAIANDSAGHILISSWAPKSSVFYVYRYNDPFDANPVKLIQWTNNNPAAIAGDGGVGRRMNVYGDVNKNASIAATAGVSNITYSWRVESGTLVNNTPSAIPYASLTSTWSFYAETQPASVAANGDYFVNYPAEIALVNGATNNRTIAFTTETSVVGIGHMTMDYFNFNNANFLAIATFKNAANTKLGMSLFDVTKSSNIGLTSTAVGFSSFRVFASPDASDLNATANGNGAADICCCYSSDRERMYAYILLTNGGVAAYEFTKYAP
ncbi:MAG: DUF5018 domain-containing protein [Chitinophagaceae bacterium]